MTTILVVEDSADLRTDMIEMLTLEGFTVIGAADGEEGVEAAQQHRPDLIVCDIMMPKLDGYGVLKTLRKNPVTAIIPFIFLTAKTDPLDLRHGMVLGADDYLTKPTRIQALLESIHVRLEKRRVMNERADEKIKNLRKNLISALPHEFRTPLNTILGFSDMLLGESQYIKPDQVAEWAQLINSAAMRLFHLSENYIYYSQLQLLVHNEEKRAEATSKVVGSIKQKIESQAMQKAQQLERESELLLSLEDCGVVQMSEEGLERIVDELVANACKFSKEGSTIQINGTVNGQYYRLHVHNEGRGMKPEHIEAIGPYMQFEREEYEQQGIGLGLAIVKQLVELFDGDFTVDSVHGQETNVFVKLKLA